MRHVLVPRDLPPAMPLPYARDLCVRTLAGETMGTTWLARLVVEPARPLEPVRAAILSVLDRVVAEMSPWIADSDISRFNRAAPGTWHELPADFFEVLDYAQTLAAETGGAFDPAAGALVNLWGFGPPGPRSECPGDESVAALLHARKPIRLASGRRAFQPGGVSLDLSGVAKGFAVDRVSQALSRLGIAGHLVEIGGELRGEGTKPDGTPWWVALEDSAEEDFADGRSEPSHTVAALHGLSVATSGDGVRYFRSGGRRYSHTIDPRTGYPVPERIASVTVLHRRCMCADALATALMVLGPEAGFEHAADRGVAARFIVRTDSGYHQRITPAFAAMLD